MQCNSTFSYNINYHTKDSSCSFSAISNVADRCFEQISAASFAWSQVVTTVGVGQVVKVHGDQMDGWVWETTLAASSTLSDYMSGAMRRCNLCVPTPLATSTGC